MSDDIIFVLQIDSSLHCAVENVDILDSRPKVATLWSTNRDLCPVSWAKATCKQTKDSILCHFHWIQIPPFIWSDKKFALEWWLLSLSKHLLLKFSYQNICIRVSNTATNKEHLQPISISCSEFFRLSRW